MKSIRSKLISTFLLVVILVVSTIGVVSFTQTKKLVEKDFENNTNETIKSVNNSIDSFFINSEQSINTMASANEITKFNGTTEAETELIGTMERYVANMKDYQSVYFGSEAGKMYLMPKQDLPAGYDPRQRPWYQDAIKSDGVVWTDAYADASTGVTIISAAKAIKVDGKVIGVFGVDISLNKLSEIITGTTLGKTGYLALLDNKGTTLAHPDKKLLAVDLSKEGFVQKVMKDDSGFFAYTYKGVDKYMAFMKNSKKSWKIMGVIQAQELADKVTPIRNISILLSVVGTLLVLVLSYFIAGSLTGNIRKLMDSMKKAENGDMTAKVDVKSKDEVGALASSYNNMLENISKLVSNVSTSAEAIATSASMLENVSADTANTTREVASTVHEIARGAEEQASDAQNSAELIAGLSVKITEITEKTKNMIESANKAAVLNEDGANAMKQVKQKSDENNQFAGEVAFRISELNEKAGLIGKIVDAITAISSQTNLLALNAAIEAARAGEAGKGFAVVADEVRKLAEDSGKAASEIKSLISSVQDSSKNAVNAMSKAKVVVDSQTKMVDETEILFAHIAESVDGITNQIESVFTLITDINISKDKIVDSVQNISSVTEETAAASEEVTASTEVMTTAVEHVAISAKDLNNSANILKESISIFKINR